MAFWPFAPPFAVWSRHCVKRELSDTFAGRRRFCALQELASDKTTFSAIITDVRLGKGPSGWEVGKRAREVTSGVPVVYMSGDSLHEWSANGVPESMMLQKPFVIAQLISALTTLLNNAVNASALSTTSAETNRSPKS